MYSADWCKEFSSKLAVFNIAYVKRKGLGLFNIVELKGNDEAVRYCFEQEKKYFSENGIDIVLNPEKPFEDKINFYEKYEGVNKNTFDISRCIIPNPAKDFFKALHLDGNFEDFKEDLNKIDYKKYSMEKLVNNTIMAHYRNHIDENFYADDIAWIIGKVIDKNKKDNSESVSKPVKFDESEKSVEENKIINQSEPNDDKTKIPDPSLNGMKINPEKKDIDFIKTTAGLENKQEEKTDTEIKIETETKEEEETFIPKPVQITKKTDELVKKEELSEAEIENNKKYLAQITEKYNEVINLIENLHNSKWKILLNRIKDALKTKKFNQQWCLLYLEVSDDVSTELYLNLYNLDEFAKVFNKNIIHQVLPMGCPMCGTSWDEDITFETKGVHYIECPNCTSSRPYEKIND